MTNTSPIRLTSVPIPRILNFDGRLILLPSSWSRHCSFLCKRSGRWSHRGRPLFHTRSLSKNGRHTPELHNLFKILFSIGGGALKDRMWEGRYRLLCRVV